MLQHLDGFLVPELSQHIVHVVPGPNRPLLPILTVAQGLPFPVHAALHLHLRHAPAEVHNLLYNALMLIGADQQLVGQQYGYHLYGLHVGVMGNWRLLDQIQSVVENRESARLGYWTHTQVADCHELLKQQLLEFPVH